MASRKKLSPVSSPVDPFVTPANPGPAQSDQSWQGLLSLSNSLMQADAAYREADEKREREARVKAAEGRRVQAEAEDAAPVAFAAFKTTEGQALLKRLNDKDASQEDMLKGQQMLKDAGVTAELNPILLGAMERFEVTTLADTNQYINRLSSRDVLDSLSGKTPQEQQNIRDQLKAQWIADQNVKDSLLPVLMESLRSRDAQLNTIYGTERKTQHVAERKATIVHYTGNVVNAFTDGDDATGTPEDLARLVEVYKFFGTEDQKTTSAELAGTLGAAFRSKIARGELSDGDADALVEAMTPMLTERQVNVLDEIITREKAQLAAQGTALRAKRAATEQDIQDRLTTLVLNAQAEAEEKESFLSEDAGITLIKGQYEDIGKQLAAAGFSKDGAARLMKEAIDSFKAQLNEKIVLSPRNQIILQKGLVDLPSEYMANLDFLLQDRKISPEQYRFYSGSYAEAVKSAPSRVVANVAQRVTTPVGVSDEQAKVAANLAYDELKAAGRDSDEISSGVQKAYRDNLIEQQKKIDVAESAFWLSNRNQGVGGGLNTNILNQVKNLPALQEYYGDKDAGLDPMSDVLGFIFEAMSDKEKANFRNLSEGEAALVLNQKIGEVAGDTKRFADSMEKRVLDKRDRDRGRIEKGQTFKEGHAVKKQRMEENQAFKTKALDYWRPVMARSSYNVRTPEQRVINALTEFGDQSKNIDILEERLPRAVIRDVPVSDYLARRYGGDGALARGRFGLSFTPLLQREVVTKTLNITRALAQYNNIKNTEGDSLQMLDFPSNTPMQAHAYIKSHFLHYGMPLTSLIKGKHLGVDVDTNDFAFDSAPFFSSREDLNAEINYNAESGEWEITENIKKVFSVLKIEESPENFTVFYNAQQKLTTENVKGKAFMKAMHNPDFSILQSEADKKVGQMTFINGSTDLFSGDSKPNVFSLKSLTDKIGGN